MEITIVNLKRNPDTGCVRFVDWVGTKEVDGRTAKHSETLVIKPKDPSDPTFVAFEDLTEEQVKTWITNATSELYMSQVEAELDDRIAQQATQNVSGKPW